MGRRRTRRPISGYSVCLENFHRKIEQKLKITPDAPKNERGLTQMIMIGESIRQIWVKMEGRDSLVVSESDYWLLRGSGLERH